MKSITTFFTDSTNKDLYKRVVQKYYDGQYVQQDSFNTFLYLLDELITINNNIKKLFNIKVNIYTYDCINIHKYISNVNTTELYYSLMVYQNDIDNIQSLYNMNNDINYISKKIGIEDDQLTIINITNISKYIIFNLLLWEQNIDGGYIKKKLI